MEVGELSLPDVRKDSSNITNSGTSGRTILSNHIFYHKVTYKKTFFTSISKVPMEISSFLVTSHLYQYFWKKQNNIGYYSIISWSNNGMSDRSGSSNISNTQDHNRLLKQ